MNSGTTLLFTQSQQVVGQADVLLSALASCSCADSHGCMFQFLLFGLPGITRQRDELQTSSFCLFWRHDTPEL
jgi:hypothetical protein